MVHPLPALISRLLERANRPVDGASLALFRLAFGLALVVLAGRFFTHGWIEADYRAATVFFPYWGFGWIRPLPGMGMEIVYGAMGVAALGIALGAFYRPACALFFTTFTYAHLCDKANYLNHYYLISLVTFWLIFLPLGRQWSVRAWRKPAAATTTVRAWMLWLLRFQFGLVYAFGGIAKLGGDWLIHGEPLRIWLGANADFPLLGGLFQQRWVAFAASYAGLCFDLSIVPLLLWSKTRKPAYVLLLGFHVMTGLLFKIGMFPWLMSIGATLFFTPSWPRFRREGAEITGSRPAVAGAALGRSGMAVLALYAIVQVLIPLRHVLYPGNTLWTEEGFRFAWRVMLIEKGGELSYLVVDSKGQRTEVSPRAYLTPFQTRMCATQPDMILQLAQVVARDFEARGAGPVQVFADARTSFNGRPNAVLIDPRVDLARETDGFRAKTWIMPAPTGPPEF